jgi:Transcriptional activator of glycolytic enzymes
MVAEHLRTMTGVVQTGFQSNDFSIRRMQGMVDVRLGAIESTLHRICEGSFTFTPGSSRGSRVQESQLSSSLPLCLPTAAPSSGPMPAPTAIENLAEQPPAYHMSRSITKIPELWLEWTVGLRGQLSVEALDERWGSRWRHGAEFQFYSRRKVIIDEIKRLMAGGREAMDVVDSLEDQRKKSNASLSQVINGLKAEAKARNAQT